MGRYILKRLIQMIPVLLGVIILAFLLNELAPGDPAVLLAGGESATPEAVAKIREELKLDDPFIVRFGDYFKKLITEGNIGTSYKTRQPVAAEVAHRFPQTFKMAAISAIFASVIGITLGVISAIKQYTFLDNIISMISLVGVSMPVFWSSLLGILFFSIYLKWLPSSGFDTWKHWLLPCFVIGASMAASIMRMTRSSMLEVIRQDYIRTARAKGQTERVVIFKHALKNALIPVITNIGMHFGVLLGGAVIIETIFVIPGIGKYITDAIKNRDYPVVQGSVLVLALVTCYVNLGVDLLYALIDPRIKSQYRGMVKKKKAKPIREETA